MPFALVLPILLQAAPVLRLADAEARARKAQPTLQQAHALTEAAEARADIARAPGLPQLTATATYQRLRTAAFGGRGGTTLPGGTTGGVAGGATGNAPTAIPSAAQSPGGVNVFTFGGSLSQVIWDWGQVYNRTRAAKRAAASLEASEQGSARTVVADVRRTYFTARAQKELVVVAQDTLANLQRHLDQIQGFVKVGTRPDIDLAQARTDLANGRLTLIDSQNQYALAKAQLARAVGDPDLAHQHFEIADDELGPVEGEGLPAAELAARAVHDRPETLALERQVDSFELTARAARGAYAPSLIGTAGASETGTALGSLGPAWNVGVSLTWPLFQGGLTRGQVREAEANAAASRAQLEAARLQIHLEVEQAQLGITSAKAARTAAEEAMTNARERLRLAEGRYTNGVGSVIELGDAQVAVATAGAQVVGAQFRLSSARADLLAALGKP